MYHYSPKTGKPEICKSTSQENCPYHGYMHSEEYSLVERYSDEENRAISEAYDNCVVYLRKDWSISSEKPAILTSYSQDGRTRITRDIIKQLGVNQVIQKKLMFNDFVVFPKTKDAIQVFLSDYDRSKEMFKELKDGFERGDIRRSETGEPYDRWAVMEAISNKHDGWIENKLNMPITLTSPTGRQGYTAMDCWQDYAELKAKSSEGWILTLGGQDFYLMTIKSGPKKIDDNEKYLRD